MKKNPNQKQFDVLVFCAGAGTRTYPYTKTTPKALLPLIDGSFPLSLICAELSLIGVTRIIASYSYGKEQFQKAAEHIKKKYRITVQLSEEKEPTGHGGGLRSARQYFTHDTILAMNGDTVISTEGAWSSQIIETCSDRTPFTILGIDEKDGPLKVDPEMNLVGLKDRVFKQSTQVRACNALGVYAFHISSLDLIPPSEFFGLFGIDDLAERIIRNEKEVRLIIPSHIPERIEIRDKETYENLLTHKYIWKKQ